MLIPILEFKDATHQERLDKLIEECKEVYEAYGTRTKEEVLSEYMDVIQVCITNMYQIATQEEIEQAATTHELKMIDRGYEIKGCWSVKLL